MEEWFIKKQKVFRLHEELLARKEKLYLVERINDDENNKSQLKL